MSDNSNNHPTFDTRPWGSFTVLEEQEHWKVKRIEVLPHKRLSYQKHRFRQEHWFVVAGTGTVVLDGEKIVVPTGTAIDIPHGSAHRMCNEHDELLVFIEVQQGTYFGEDDIIRLEDDFGRQDG